MPFDLWDVFQHHQIRSMGNAMRATNLATDQKVGRAMDAMLRLEQKIDRLLLINRAMWELIEERSQLTREDLARRVTEIDLRDGQEDGRYRPQAVDCPECDSKICIELGRCLFCGYRPENSDVFSESP